MSEAKTLQSELAAASLEFGQPKKDKKGQYRQSRFEYASLKSIVEAVRGPLAKHGISMVQLLSSDGEKAVVELVVSGYGDRLSAKLEFAHPSTPQEFGSLVTYMRRYQIQAFFCLEGDVDADDTGDEVHAKPPVKAVKSAAQEAAAEEQHHEKKAALEKLKVLIERAGIGAAKWREMAAANGFGTTPSNLSLPELQKAISVISAEIKE